MNRIIHIHDVSAGSKVKLADNFNSEEFECQCRIQKKGEEGYGYLGCWGRCRMSAELISDLQTIRSERDKPIYIIDHDHSGYRCGKHNLEVRGKPNSYHIAGLAVDVDDGYDLLAFYNDILSLYNEQKIGYIRGIYYKEALGLIHLDIRPTSRLVEIKL